LTVNVGVGGALGVGGHCAAAMLDHGTGGVTNWSAVQLPLFCGSIAVRTNPIFFGVELSWQGGVALLAFGASGPLRGSHEWERDL
jgi:hypothetical protein